jgi:transcriptional regulator with XRE-family HTH domain
MPRRDDPQLGLGKAIRALRLKSEMSQDALGKKSDIHPTWISHIESGRINPTWGNVRRIAHGLGVPLGELADLAQHFESDPLTAKLRCVSIPKVPAAAPAAGRPAKPAGRERGKRSEQTEPLDVEALVALRDQTE